EDGGAFEIGRAARKHRAVHEITHGIRRDATVAEQMIHASVDGDDAVEHAGLRVGVETDEDFWDGPLSVVRGPLHKMQCPLSSMQRTTDNGPRTRIRIRGTGGPPYPCRR